MFLYLLCDFRLQCAALTELIRMFHLESFHFHYTTDIEIKHGVMGVNVSLGMSDIWLRHRLLGGFDSVSVKCNDISDLKGKEQGCGVWGNINAPLLRVSSEGHLELPVESPHGSLTAAPGRFCSCVTFWPLRRPGALLIVPPTPPPGFISAEPLLRGDARRGRGHSFFPVGVCR